jgi:hypothetical protein
MHVFYTCFLFYNTIASPKHMHYTLCVTILAISTELTVSVNECCVMLTKAGATYDPLDDVR